MENDNSNKKKILRNTKKSKTEGKSNTRQNSRKESSRNKE
jgi:hypothetical protein